MIQIVKNIQEIIVDNHKYNITINYCKNCGSLKSTSNIRHIK